VLDGGGDGVDVAEQRGSASIARRARGVLQPARGDGEQVEVVAV